MRSRTPGALRRLIPARLRRRLSGLVGQQGGQALPLFLVMVFVIVGAVAIVTDVSWFWVSQQRMQRAADAASLAGAVYLPGNIPVAYSTAQDAATLNGYTDGLNGVTVTPLKDPSNNRRLIVTVSGPVDTMFARIFNSPQFNKTSTDTTQIAVSAKSKAEYVLPVPMGSPQNYYGVGYYVGPTTTSSNPASNQRNAPSSTPVGVPTATWTNPTFAYGAGVTNAAANNANQYYGNFNFQTNVPNDPTLVVEGIQVRMTGVDLQGSGTRTTCQLKAELSWNAGTSWSTSQNTSNLSISPINADIGSATTMVAWGGHSWTYADFSNANFRIRLTWNDGTATCDALATVDVDDVDVQAYWHTTTTSTAWALKPVLSPTGGVLAPQNFWAAMQSQGAPSIQGDAFMTKYETRTSTANAAYDYDGYYNYGVDIPVGATNGQVWIFDPGFCDTGTAYGLGENWTVGGGNGNSLEQPASSYYEVWDTRGTPYDTSDDVRKDVTTDDTDYRRLKLADGTSPGANTTDSGGTSITSCASLSWHFGWVRIANNLPGNTTYRLHTFTTDKTSLTDQDDTTALNAFAVWSTATGGTPRVYGIGAMEAYVKLPQGTVSEFYLAQIEAAHAGKTLVIELWDPGDTGNLAATLQILAPNSSNYAATTFSWASAQGTGNAGASSCDGQTGTSVTSVVTNTGGSSKFNGCWLTITIPLPSTYTAPHPSSDGVTTESGWWKIRYTMGSGSGDATDLTTWKVSIRGSPVHLVN